VTKQAGYLASNAGPMSARNVEYIRELAIATMDPVEGHISLQHMKCITSFAIATRVTRMLKAALGKASVSAIGIRDGSAVLVTYERGMRLGGIINIARNSMVAARRCLVRA